MQSIWQSMSPEMRDQLRDARRGFQRSGLQSAMMRPSETLSQLMPMESYDTRRRGDEPMTLAEALGLMDEMNSLSDMEDTVRSARAAEDLEALNVTTSKGCGPVPVSRSTSLRKMTELLEEAGLIRKDGERYERKPRGNPQRSGQRSIRGHL